MKLHRLSIFAIIALGALSLGASCPNIPQLKERIVELAVGGSTTLEFDENAHNDLDLEGDYDLTADIDIHKLLDDAGIDASDVKDIKVSGISYRVVVPAATSTAAIQNGNVYASRGGGPEVQLVTSFNQNVGSATGWITAPISSAGVSMLNTLLSDILTAEQNGTPVVNPQIHYRVDGTTNEAAVFTWAIKIDVSIVGTIKLDVLT